jgi:GTP cyclohydrolase I
MNKKKKERLLANSLITERAGHVQSLINSIFGERVCREGLQDTPLRVAAMYEELFAGYNQDGKQILEDAMFNDTDSHDLVIVKDIQFYSTCEHHMMPFFGTATVAYIPQDGKIVGLSKIARLVDVYARRLQVQERMGKQILEDIKAVMNPFGVAVILKAEHTCMTARGVQKPGTQTVTSAMDGVFKLDDKARNELLQLIK